MIPATKTMGWIRSSHIHKHTHTHIYIHAFEVSEAFKLIKNKNVISWDVVYMCVCVCV